MVEKKESISKKTYISAFLILLTLVIIAGILTRVVPTGEYQWTVENGKNTIVQDSFRYTNIERLLVYKWFTAPVELLFTKDGVIVIAIIAFLLIIGGSIHILNETNILKSIIFTISERFKTKKKQLMAVIIFAFMLLGATLGIFEEIIPLVPFIILLSEQMGWDRLTGLGMSVLACGFGFSAAVSNPFTIGVAQKLAGLPLFSGFGYRLIVFAAVYLLLLIFLGRYSRKLEGNDSLPCKAMDILPAAQDNKKGILWFAIVMSIMLATILASTFVPVLSQYNLPIISIFFLVAGIGAGMFSGLHTGMVFKHFIKGSAAMLPGIVLILLASSVKYIITSGGIMDTILYNAAAVILKASPFAGVAILFMLVLFMNFFIGSGSAKAFIIMPIILPLMDMLHVSRQLAILGFQFGDGFSNVLYPTNAVLLISLGLADVSYSKWAKWIIRLQLVIFAVSMVFLYIGFRIGY